MMTQQKSDAGNALPFSDIFQCSGMDIFEDRVNSFIEFDQRDLLVDMGQLDYIDSMTLAVLVRCASRLFVTGRKVTLVNCNEKIVRCISLAGIENLLNIEEAV